MLFLKKSIYRIFSIMLIALLLITNLPVAFAEEHVPYVSDVFSHEVVNPMLGDVKVPQVTYAKTYKSGSQESFDPENYVGLDAAAAQIRDAMEARQEIFTVQYCSDYELTKPGIEALMELAFTETDQPTEGDSLRYCYSRRKTSYGYYLVANKYYNDLTFEISYYTTAQQEAELSEAVDDLVDSFGFSSFTDDRYKVDRIYEYITDKVKYDYDHLNQNDYWLQFTAYAALLNKKAVCEGYAVLFYRLAEECGLDARVITGVGGTGRDANHAWNIVKLGDYYYYLDATWDAEREPGSAYAWYLKGSTDFLSHSNESEFNSQEFNDRYPIPQKGMDIDIYDGPHTFGDYEYYKNSRNAIITKYKGEGGDVVVPAKVNNIPVISVDNGAFYQNNTVTSITFSEGIASLYPQAVEYCHALKSIHFPSTMNLKDYGSRSYTDVPINNFVLEKITVAEGNPYIKIVDGILYTNDMNTLLLCPALYPKSELQIPDGVVEIGNNSVSDCIHLKKVTMTDSVERIWFWSFTACYDLEEIRISNSCQTIGQFFLTATKVKSLHIPASVTEIMPDAFGTDVSYLESITVDPENPIYRIENGALRTDTKLIRYPALHKGDSFIVPEGITSLEVGAFSDAKDLRKISLPNSLRKIENSAFSGCAGLTHVTIPNGTTHMAKYVFWECNMLMSVIIPESVAEMLEYNLFHPCDALTIYGKKNTLAETCANENNFTFKDISEFICVDGHQIGEEIIHQTEFHKTFRYKCTRCGAKTIENYSEEAKDINNADVTLEYTEIQYDGKTHKPKITSVTYEGEKLKENVDYTYIYFSDGSYADSHYIEIKGIGRFAGTNIAQYVVTPKPLTNVTFKDFSVLYPYNGYAHNPINFVVLSNGEEISWENLYCTYKNNVNVGEATGTLHGKGNYTGSIDFNFYIYPAEKLGTAYMGGDANIALDMAELKGKNLLSISLNGASIYTLKTYSPNGAVKVYADAERKILVANNTDIKLDGGITKLYALAPNKNGTLQKYEIEIHSPQYSAYTDKLTNWAKPYIEKLNQTGLGLFKGDEHGRFNGKKGLNRYEMAAVLLRLQGTNKDLFKNCENPFIDKIPSWALNYVKAAYKLGLIKGYEVKLSNKKVAYEFRGKNTATRNEFFRLFMNVVIGDIAPEYLGDINSYYEANKAKINAFVKAKGFKDAGKVANWAKPGTYTAIYFGYVNGTNDKKINPTTVITREAAATLIAQALA